jgi:hypothetical protein
MIQVNQMESHRQREKAKDKSNDSDSSTSDDELEADSDCSPLRRQKCQSNWSSSSKVRREEERLRARQKASALVRSMSDDTTPAKSPLKLSRRKDRDGRSARRSSLKGRRTTANKPVEPVNDEEKDDDDEQEDDSDVPTLLRRVSDELLKFFGEEDSEDNAKQQTNTCSETQNDPINADQLEPETSILEQCETVKSLRRKDSIMCRTFTNTQAPSESELSDKVARTAARRHKDQLSSKYKTMIEKAGASKTSLFGESRASLMLNGELSLASLQYDHNQSFSESRRAETDLFNASFSYPIKNKKGIRLHSTSVIQNQKQTVPDPPSPKEPLTPPPDMNREISVEALKASICKDKDSPVTAKRNLGAKKMFGNMMEVLQTRSD